ncbi:MAG: hypothetical protein UHD09_08480 [Bifidobacterium sp.]|nr:hypothetical protein [Bifidobacterium sp.]
MNDEQRCRNELVSGRIDDALPRLKGIPVFSHNTAVLYWGSETYDNDLDDHLVHISVDDRDRRPRLVGIHAHLWTAPLETSLEGGYEVVRPAVCWAQMAQYATRETLIKIASNFTCRDQKRRVASLDELATYVKENKKFRGRSTLLEILPFLVEGTDSPEEGVLADFLIANEFGRPVINYRVPLDDGDCYLDAAFPDLKLGFEYQGAYHSGVDQMRRDADKHNHLIKRGWKIVYVTANDFATKQSRRALRDIIASAKAQQACLMSLRAIL